MSEVDQGSISNFIVEHLWWGVPVVGTFLGVALLSYIGGGWGEAKATTMNLVDDDRRGGSQVTPPSDSASAEYGSMDPAVLAGLPPSIYYDVINGRNVLCGELGTEWGTSWSIYYALKMAGILDVKPSYFFVDRDGNRVYEDRNWGLDPRNFTEPWGAISCMPVEN